MFKNDGLASSGNKEIFASTNPDRENGLEAAKYIYKTNLHEYASTAYFKSVHRLS